MSLFMKKMNKKGKDKHERILHIQGPRTECYKVCTVLYLQVVFVLMATVYPDHPHSCIVFTAERI